MTWDEIFTAYYSQYRAEKDIPASTEDEYTIALRLANEAINRWSNYDNTMWRELFTTLQASGDGDLEVSAGVTDYSTPDDMVDVGGKVKLLDAAGNTKKKYKILSPEKVQFQGDLTAYAYFTGDPNNGFTLHINPAPDSTLNGLLIDYPYYKKPTLLTAGADLPDMNDPYFIVHRMLANRFRTSRNPYYGTAKQDAEDALSTMQLKNNSGSWANPFTVEDHSGTTFGI